MEYYGFLFEGLLEDKKNILLALLNDIGFTGFEETEDSLHAFIAKDEYNETVFQHTISAITTSYHKSVIKEVNWNEQWESGFEPITVLHPVSGEAFAHIRANFHSPAEGNALDIIITPKMSFGTGHHATTYIMAEQMSKLSFTWKNVVDFGTGTGVLAILAEKMGAAAITAIDNDDWSISNAGENIEANRCNRIKLVKAETIPAGDKYGIVLANINTNIIVNNLQAIKEATDTGSVILFSGMMTPDEPVILAALASAGIKANEIFKKNGWIAILAVCV